MPIQQNPYLRERYGKVVQRSPSPQSDSATPSSLDVPPGAQRPNTEVVSAFTSEPMFLHWAADANGVSPSSDVATYGDTTSEVPSLAISNSSYQNQQKVVLDSDQVSPVEVNVPSLPVSSIDLAALSMDQPIGATEKKIDDITTSLGGLAGPGDLQLPSRRNTDKFDEDAVPQIFHIVPSVATAKKPSTVVLSIDEFDIEKEKEADAMKLRRQKQLPVVPSVELQHSLIRELHRQSEAIHSVWNEGKDGNTSSIDMVDQPSLAKLPLHESLHKNENVSTVIDATKEVLHSVRSLLEVAQALSPNHETVHDLQRHANYTMGHLSSVKQDAVEDLQRGTTKREERRDERKPELVLSDPVEHFALPSRDESATRVNPPVFTAPKQVKQKKDIGTTECNILYLTDLRIKNERMYSSCRARHLKQQKFISATSSPNTSTEDAKLLMHHRVSNSAEEALENSGLMDVSATSSEDESSGPASSSKKTNVTDEVGEHPHGSELVRHSLPNHDQQEEQGLRELYQMRAMVEQLTTQLMKLQQGEKLLGEDVHHERQSNELKPAVQHRQFEPEELPKEPLPIVEEQEQSIRHQFLPKNRDGNPNFEMKPPPVNTAIANTFLEIKGSAAMPPRSPRTTYSPGRTEVVGSQTKEAVPKPTHRHVEEITPPTSGRSSTASSSNENHHNSCGCGEHKHKRKNEKKAVPSYLMPTDSWLHKGGDVVPGSHRADSPDQSVSPSHSPHTYADYESSMMDVGQYKTQDLAAFNKHAARLLKREQHSSEKGNEKENPHRWGYPPVSSSLLMKHVHPSVKQKVPQQKSQSGEMVEETTPIFGVDQLARHVR